MGSLVVFCCFVPVYGATYPFSRSYTGLFFFKSFITFNPRSVRGREGGGGRVGGTWDLVASFEDNPLFLSSKRFLRLLIWLRVMSSSSSLESIRATTNLGKSTTEDLSSLTSEFETSTGLSGASPSSSRWN